MGNVGGAAVVVLIGIVLVIVSRARSRAAQAKGVPSHDEESPLMQQAQKVYDDYRRERDAGAGEEDEQDE